MIFIDNAKITSSLLIDGGQKHFGYIYYIPVQFLSNFVFYTYTFMYYLMET